MIAAAVKGYHHEARRLWCAHAAVHEVRQRGGMMRVSRVTSVIVAALISGMSALSAAAQTTVYVVRHAEKADVPPADPPLTAAGEARARVLADSMKAHGIKAIITTQFLRTKATAAPTAAEFGVTPEVIPATSPQHIQAIAAEVRKHAGEAVLVVGHSNTVPGIIAALGAAPPAPLCDAEYDNLYIVTLTAGGAATVAREHYGAPTPVGPNCAAMK
jgi:broad specificity phosphatase PhoE